MKNLVIFQNYYTPYRSKLFQEIGKSISLTVVYLQKPQDEGRKWDEGDFEIAKTDRTFKTLQLDCKNLGFPKLKLGPIIWPKNLSQLDKLFSKETTVIFLDNLPTNFAMNKIISYASKTIPSKQRVLWVEHIVAPETAKSRIPFYQLFKNFYKYSMTFLLALKCDKILTFSDMSTAYCKRVGLPLQGQKMFRTYQATYTESEIEQFSKASQTATSNVTRPLTFGFLGYFTTRKGLSIFLQAIKYSPTLNAKFLFIGDGPEKATLLRAAEADERISVLDYVKNEEEKSNIFSQMDVHVIPSEKDPWCLVVNEAASRGVPSIVSPFVGAKEMMKPVAPQFLLESNNALALAKAFLEIEKLRNDEKSWKDITNKTLASAAKWSIEKASEGILGVGK